MEEKERNRKNSETLITMYYYKYFILLSFLQNIKMYHNYTYTEGHI